LLHMKSAVPTSTALGFGAHRTGGKLVACGSRGRDSDGMTLDRPTMSDGSRCMFKCILRYERP